MGLEAWEVDFVGSVSCPVIAFGISFVEFAGYVIC
jgi:hypothetical protein